MSGLPEFEPDPFTLELLQQEHENGTWIGRRLLAVANRIRDRGGCEDDYRRWVLSSGLWLSYTSSTGDSGAAQRRNLGTAWDRSTRSKPFELDDALSALLDRIATGYWTGKAGSRNREVALAFVRFCRDRNCFTRTISCYELSKHTSGLSPNVVYKGLRDLVLLGLLTKVDRTDRRVSSRSTSRYRINLDWKAPRSGGSVPSPGGYCGTDIRSTSNSSLSPERNSATGDLWSSRGLGLTAGRVYEALTDEPASINELSKRAGLTYYQTRRALVKLADHCLAGLLPGRPVRYFKVETPLGVVADMLGCTGYVDHVIGQTEARQHANRVGYPSSYSTREPETRDSGDPFIGF